MTLSHADSTSPALVLSARLGHRVGRVIRGLVVALLGLALVVLTVGVAWAYWSAEGGGEGTATAGTMAVPNPPSVSVTPGSAEVAVSWDGVRAPDGGFVDGYYLQRLDGETASPACGSGPGSLLPSTPTSCTDAAVPNGEFTYTVTAVVGSWTAESSPSAPVTVEALAFQVDAPASTVAGSPMSVTVTALDGSGRPDRRYRGTIRFTSSDPQSPVLPGEYSFHPSDNGSATFTNGVELRTAGTQTVMVADTTTPEKAGSTTLTVTPAAAVRVALTGQPGGGVSNEVWSAQPQGSVLDAYGNTVVSSTAGVSLALASGPAGATLTCEATTKNAVEGVAAFSGCRIDTSGRYTVELTSPSLAGEASSSFTVAPGAPSKLVMTSQPGHTVAGDTISPAVSVALQDAAGNVVIDSPATVELALGANPGGATLGGQVVAVTTDGVATFSDLSVDKVGSGYTLAATSTGLTAATSTAFNVSVGAPSRVAFTVNPGGGTGGVNWSTQPRVAIQDAFGNQVTTSTANVTLSITPGSGAPGALLTCSATTRAASAGLATFSSCKIDKAAQYTLTATSTGLASGESGSFTVAVGAATKLGYAGQPTAVVAGSEISPAVSVAVQDAGGNTVTSSSATVNIAIGTNPAGGTLSGTVSAVASNGIATFSDLSINRSSASNYTLTSTSSGLTSSTSTTFKVNAGAATRLAFTVQPGGGTGGVAWSTQPRVAVQDALGNTVLNAAGSVTLAITPGTGTSGAVLTCSSNPRALSSGVATYSGCRIDKAGSGYTLTASQGSLTAATSNDVNVAVGPATKLGYTVQPTAIVAGATISPDVTVTVQDAGGNTVTSSSATVNVAIGTNPAAGTLSGTLSKQASSGVATFSDLSINRSSTSSYTLVASSSPLTSATSTGFVVSVGAPAQLAFTTQPGGGAANATWVVQPRVTVQDALGNTVTSSSAPVTLTVTGGTGTAGAVLTCSVNPRTAAAGLATFSGCRIDRAGTGYTLTATSSSLTGVSSGFTIS